MSLFIIVIIGIASFIGGTILLATVSFTCFAIIFLKYKKKREHNNTDYEVNQHQSYNSEADYEEVNYNSTNDLNVIDLHRNSAYGKLQA